MQRAEKSFRHIFPGVILADNHTRLVLFSHMDSHGLA